MIARPKAPDSLTLPYPHVRKDGKPGKSDVRGEHGYIEWIWSSTDSTATYWVSDEVLSGQQRFHPCPTERVRKKHDFSRLKYGRISSNKVSFEPKTSRSRGTRLCSGQTWFCFAKTNICSSRTQFCSSKTKPVR